jgi:EAL domain-containing protein (putative c-di-GMP-specific phosphodiesterase class I)
MPTEVDLKSGRVVGLEALIGWQHPERGMLLPSGFIPAAEDSRLTMRIGELACELPVLRTKRGKTRGWRRCGLLLTCSQFSCTNCEPSPVSARTVSTVPYSSN